MKFLYYAALAALFCASCTTAQPPGEPAGETVDAHNSEHIGEPTGESRVQFLCDNSESIEMRFFPLQGVGVLVRNGTTMELQQQPSGSGFLYTNGPTTVRGKGDELIMEIGRMAPIRCDAVNTTQN